MPLYMSTFGYKPEVWAGLVKSPENREKAVSQILEEAGCELRGLLVCLRRGGRLRAHRGAGQHDGGWPGDRDHLEWCVPQVRDDARDDPGRDARRAPCRF